MTCEWGAPILSGSRRNLTFFDGATADIVVRWGSGTYSSAVITGISKATPAVVTATAHGVPDGWPVAVVAAGGMRQLNAKYYPPRDGDWHQATRLTTDSVQLNKVSSAEYSTYTAGGTLVFDTPVSLVGVTARMRVYDSESDGTVLLTLTEASGIALNTTNSTITISFTTVGLTWTSGYYDLELTDGSGKVTQLLSGTIDLVF
jgi:hypothetical protein